MRPKCIGWRYYGARGITMCKEWQDSFVAFLEHIGPKPSPKHSIDRIDNNKGYEPGNVRWATAKEQARNTTVNRMVECDGKRLSISEWAEIVGMKSATLTARLNKGWPIEEALSVPIRKWPGKYASCSNSQQ